MWKSLWLGGCLLVSTSMAEDMPSQLGKKGRLLFEDDFSSAELNPAWQAQHGTRWSVQDGFLRGTPSSKEFQDKKDHHKGTAPSMSCMLAMKDVYVQMDFRIKDLQGVHFGFNDGSTKDGTGHVCRVTMSVKDGITLQKDTNSQLEGDKDETLLALPFELREGVWYTLVYEVKGEKFAMSLLDGVSGKASHARLNVSKSWLNLKSRGGKESSQLDYDNVKIWELVD